MAENSKIEKVARAMWERTHDGSWADAPRNDEDRMIREVYRKDAEVALAAMDSAPQHHGGV